MLNICLKLFNICEGYWSLSFFHCNVFIFFYIKVMLASYNDSLFSEQHVKWYHFWNLWWNSPVKPSGPGDFLFVSFVLVLGFVEEFLTKNSNSFIDMRLFCLFISSSVSLVMCVFQEIYPIYLGSWIYWHTFVHNFFTFSIFVETIVMAPHLSHS